MSNGPARRITLLTDFGTRDGYTGALCGVIAAIQPDLRVDHAGHDIPPGDILAAALALDRYWRLYPPGTIHVVVVDPGVGTKRRGIVALADGRVLLGPDNGVLTLVLAATPDATVYEIQDPSLLRSPVSRTFHGRDIFASVAAHLAARAELPDVGPRVDDAVLLDLPRAERDGNGVTGAVLIEDRFGNLITNVPAEMVPATGQVLIRDLAPIPIRATYGEADAGAPLALVGSSERLEISIREGNAAEGLAVRRGERLRVEPA